MPATGGISGRLYDDQDIFSPELYPRMRVEPLYNGNDELVVPVRKLGQPHFRRMGAASFGTRVGRSEKNPTHDDCVQFVYDEIRTAQRVKFSTYVFSDDGSREEQVIFSPLAGSNYKWFHEANARTGFSNGCFIQPDLAGRDANKFFPRSTCPNVIIEVVRTHPPEQQTFEYLYDLSKTNTIVIFYFIAEGSRGGKLNNLRKDEGGLTVRVSHYLIGGTLYKNGAPTRARRDDESVAKWHDYLSNSYFRLAMENAT